MKFEALGLHQDLVDALHEKGYDTATPIQQQAIPAVLDKKDLMAAAQTGTGKTAGFTLPILQQLIEKPLPLEYHCYVLILTPTRELAAQVHDNIERYSKYLNSSSAVVFGGVNIKPQIEALKQGVDILVATPGRLLDLYQQNAIEFEELEIFVLDEADRMLDMGFIPDIKRIISLLPKQRQNLLFSATFSNSIRQLAKDIFKNNPVEIDIAPRNQPIELVDQKVYTVEKVKKAALLSHLITINNWHQVLVFSRTKHGADRLVKQLDKSGIEAVAIHSDKTQGQRTKALENFKNGKAQILIATDIAARGIDISQLPLVVNFDLPDAAENYVHRIGRTGRAGCRGEAISLVCHDEASKLYSIEYLTKQKIPRETVEGFEPANPVADTSSKKKTVRSFAPRAGRASGLGRRR